MAHDSDAGGIDPGLRVPSLPIEKTVEQEAHILAGASMGGFAAFTVLPLAVASASTSLEILVSFLSTRARPFTGAFLARSRIAFMDASASAGCEA